MQFKQNEYILLFKYLYFYYENVLNIFFFYAFIESTLNLIIFNIVTILNFIFMTLNNIEYFY